MENLNGYNLLDTGAFERFIAAKSELLARYSELDARYDAIVAALLQSWKGMGADAFRADAGVVKENIVGIHDILNTMCDTLTDCREIFGECDTALAAANRTALDG